MSHPRIRSIILLLALGGFIFAGCAPSANIVHDVNGWNGTPHEVSVTGMEGGGPPDASPPASAAAGATGAVFASTIPFEGAARQAFQAAGGEAHLMVYQSQIDPDDNGRLNEAKLRGWILKNVPSGYDGVVWLDWEGTWMDAFKSSDPSVVAAAVSEGTHAMTMARALRPNAKWGFYGLPPRLYWQRTDPSWRASAENCRALFKHVDVVGVSVYDFYADADNPGGGSGDQAYVADNVRLALDVAPPNVDVWFFVIETYHDSNAKRRGQYIPDDEWTAHTLAGLGVRQNGRAARGVVWWGSQYNGLRAGKIPPADGLSAAAWLDRHLTQRIETMDRAVRTGR
ncbi:MAG: hypothetical protein KDA25_10090 [Phycisphaerales bacterium]|nr:hypothetical protein [Phycisphaerales bacterium]